MGRILIGNIKGPQGEAGKNFEYAKTYASVSAMNADFSGTDVAEGEYVVISAGIDDADNGRVYRKGTSSYVYVNRVNGPTGPRGATGPMPTLVTNLDTTTAGQGALDASVGPTIKGKVNKEGGETGDTVTTFNTSDTTTDAEIIEYTAMEKLTSGSPLKTLMSIMSKAVKNVRWFQKLLGTTDISGIGNGTVTNAVSTLNDTKANKTTVDAINSSLTNVVEEMLTLSYNGKSANIYFRKHLNVLSILITKEAESMALPTTWKDIGTLTNIKAPSDRYIPFISSNGLTGTFRLYKDGGVRLIAHSNNAYWLQTSATVLL